MSPGNPGLPTGEGQAERGRFMAVPSLKRQKKRANIERSKVATGSEANMIIYDCSP